MAVVGVARKHTAARFCFLLAQNRMNSNNGTRGVASNNNNNNNNSHGFSAQTTTSSLSGSSTSLDASANNNTKQAQDLRSKFDLPNIAEDDIVLVENILNAVHSLGTEDSPLCVKYKVKVITSGYILSAFLPPIDVFEVDLDDLLFVKSISPSRIDSVCIARTAAQGSTELIVKILDHKQRIMITRSTTFSATRKRKWSSVG
jgi:hypothetical protein